MIEIMLSKEFADRLIVAFDGHVLSYYSAMDMRHGSKSGGHIHVAHIKAIAITTDRKGQHNLKVTSRIDVSFSDDPSDADQLGKVQALVAEVQRAMQTVAL